MLIAAKWAEGNERASYSHGGEDDGEALLLSTLLLYKTGLTTDLGGNLEQTCEGSFSFLFFLPRKAKKKEKKKKANLVVGQTSSGEDGNLLATGNGVHGINGGDTSLNHLLRVNAGERVNRLACFFCVKLRLFSVSFLSNFFTRLREKGGLP